ncbi:MAG: cytochrome c biogenesis protein ResB [Chthoniobacterales bacterium]
MVRKILLPFTSLKLTIVCFAFAMLLVFFGTIEQVHLGIYGAQKKYFDSFFVFWTIPGTIRHIPVLPGGYLLGGVTLLNLLAAQAVRFKFSWKKSGIYFLHLGVILLLLGQLFTSLFAKEAQMRLDEGQTKNYSESFTEKELVLTDTSDSKSDHVVSIPEGLLTSRAPITHPSLPFRVEVSQYFRNSTAVAKDQVSSPNIPRLEVGPMAVLVPIALATTSEQPNMPSAEVKIITPEQTQTFILSERLRSPKTFTVDGKTWHIDLRARRFYKPFSIKLNDFTHKIYAGTDIPKDFSSRVSISDPATGEKRDALIYMNHPLRYEGNTYYQLAFDNNDTTSILQVVRNPSWLLPYIACTLVGLGLLVQFSIHLVNFSRKRRTA